MKKIAITIAVFTISIIVASCKKEKDIIPCECPNPIPTNSDKYHFPLSVGSYWIYQEINLDSMNNVTAISGIDSIFISNDTMINGNIYFQKRLVITSGTSFFGPGLASITRDSAGYIVNQYGTFIKHDDFVNIQKIITNVAPAYVKECRMGNKDSSVTVPAGTFNTISYIIKTTILESSYTGNRIKYDNEIMANNVGLIFETASYLSGTGKVGVRLLRYHIAN